MGKRFKKKSAPQVKKITYLSKRGKIEDQPILMLRSWHKKVLSIWYQVLRKGVQLTKHG